MFIQLQQGSGLFFFTGGELLVVPALQKRIQWYQFLNCLEVTKNKDDCF